MLELHYPTVTKAILERQYPGKPTLKVAFGNGNGAIFENSSKLRASLFVTSRWPRSSGQTNYQVHHPPPGCNFFFSYRNLLLLSSITGRVLELNVNSAALRCFIPRTYLRLQAKIHYPLPLRLFTSKKYIQ